MSLKVYLSTFVYFKLYFSTAQYIIIVFYR